MAAKPRFRNLADRSRARRRRRPRCFALLCGDSPATILFHRSDCWNIRFLGDEDEHEEDSSASEFRLNRYEFHQRRRWHARRL
jgi:hypothetical protein